MPILKCKMCGGELNIVAGSTICECEYCGSKQTIPNTDDEKRLKLYERANRLRFDCEFDKAAGVYETIVADYQDEAEAYWGLVLCKYGIEYVDDPATNKKIPTCHRSSFDSVMDDANFEFVMENADAVARGVYRDEAKKIEDIRKGIIEVSSSEDPYDIFICYKETADDGQRTIDSVIAQDVYKELTENGYRVFFSRITLEDKLGQEYEPYIFAALNSAKVMLVFGTSYDYYNAVWVKNEWSRFLQLIASGQKKTLIPCYKDLDAYDMPKEFKHLQAQDMGKVGAIQDLVRGIDKIFGRDKKLTTVVVSSNSMGEENALVKRGYFALEDKDWEKAKEYFDKAMNLNAEDGEIHLGLFLAKHSFRSLEEFKNNRIARLDKLTKQKRTACEPDKERINRIVSENTVDGFYDQNEIRNRLQFTLEYQSVLEAVEKEKEVFSNKDWSKAEQYAKGEVKKNLEDAKTKVLAEIQEIIEKEKLKDSEKQARVVEEYRLFLQVAEKSIIDSRKKAESQRDSFYGDLCERQKQADTEKELNDIIRGYERIENYKDSLDRVQECKKRLSSVQSEKKEKQKKKKKKICIISIAIIVLIIISVFASGRMIKYSLASKKYESGDFIGAIKIWDDLKEYKDSSIRIQETINQIYDEAKRLFKQNEYDDAITNLNSLLPYLSESQDREYCYYMIALGYAGGGNYSDTLSNLMLVSESAGSEKVRLFCEGVRELAELDDGNEHNLKEIYGAICAFESELNLDSLVNKEYIDMMLSLNGNWYDVEGIRKFEIKDGHVCVYSVLRGSESLKDEWDILYKNGNFYMESVGEKDKASYKLIRDYGGYGDNSFLLEKYFYEHDDIDRILFKRK